ncbi:MAG: TonB-dependent receptor [Candidatus Kapaibacterium sp.]|nr:MAG: TonB-dependent receptor [Candidatus Kapabacteria bacterium]
MRFCFALRTQTIPQRLFIPCVWAIFFVILNTLLLSAQEKQQAAKLDFKPDSTNVSGQSRSKIYRVPALTISGAKADKTSSPVPFIEITKAEIEKQYTYQDIPTMLADLPSTIITSDNGNNVGYTNLSIRGFDQRRISVSLNGIPQNDPEDHNMYWINLPDLASSLGGIQVQRGAGHIASGQGAIGGSVQLTTSNFVNNRGILITSGLGVQEFAGNGGSTGNAPRFVPNIQKLSFEISSGLVGENFLNNSSEQPATQATKLSSPQYAFYARASHINSEGYRNQSWTQVTSFFLSGVRFDEHLTTQINIFGGPIADGLAYTGLPKAYTQDLMLRRRNYSAWDYDSTGRNLAYTTTRRAQEIENFSQPHYELLLDYTGIQNVVVKCAVFYYQGDGFFDYDASWADAATLRLTPEYGFPRGVQPSNALIRAFVGNRQGGIIPRVEWKHSIDWLGANPIAGELSIGAEARVHGSESWGKIRYAEGLPTGFDPDYKMYSYNGERTINSIFARENMRLSDEWLLNVEAQLVHHSYAIRNEQAGGQFTQFLSSDGRTIGNGERIFTVQYLFANPRIGAVFTPRMESASERVQFTTSLAYTSREPRMRNFYAASDAIFGATPLFERDTTSGQNAAPRYNFNRPQVRPERLFNAEFGARIASAEGAWMLGVNGYWMEFFDELVRSGQRDIFGNPIDGNAPRTRHYGIELDGAATLFQTSAGKLKLSFNATFSVNRIVEYRFQDVASERDLAGNPIANFPDALGNTRLSYEADNFFCSLSGRYVGAFYTDNFKNEANKNDAFTVVNADAAYTFRNILGVQSLRLRAQVNNVLNALYSSGGNGREFFPAAERNYYISVELGL